MKIKLLNFGIAKEITGASEMELDVPENSSIANLEAQLRSQYPALNKLRSFALALNSEYAQGAELLRAGDEVAVIPPVSGG